MPGRWDLYDESGVLIETGEVMAGGRPMAQIPFVPFYGRRLDFMIGSPPLLDLAWMNVKHWQTQSDQDDSARFARKRLLVFSGLTDDGSMTIASSQAVKLPSGADAKVVQGSAESVSVGRSELEALEAQMIQSGAELLTANPGNRTATEVANDAEANKSDLQRIVENCEDALDQCLQFTAQRIGLPDGGHASLFKDFAGAAMDVTAQIPITMQQGGMLTKLTTIKEQIRRGVLSPDIDPVAELEAVRLEGPALGVMGAGQ
jgi:hypothetical protein